MMNSYFDRFCFYIDVYKVCILALGIILIDFVYLTINDYLLK